MAILKHNKFGTLSSKFMADFKNHKKIRKNLECIVDNDK